MSRPNGCCADEAAVRLNQTDDRSQPIAVIDVERRVQPIEESNCFLGRSCARCQANPMEVEMKPVLALTFCFSALPSVAISEPVELDCSFGLGRVLSIVYDNQEGHIGLVTATEVQNIPFIETNHNVVIAFWITPDGQQFNSLSFHTVSGEIAFARVGTKEPLLRQGLCSRRE